jgi:NTE family protein
MCFDSRPVSIGIVLSAGGLRGVAHLGVLRRIVGRRIPVETMVGVSAGAIIAAQYAAVGLTVDEMIGQASVFHGRHILMHGLSLRSHASLRPYLRRFCGIIPQRLEQLESATFTRLHHGIRRLGIVCHDIERNRPRYFSTAESAAVRLADVACASAAVPGILPAQTIVRGTEVMILADGGISDSLPVEFARSPLIGATHVIVSDCRLVADARPAADDSLIYIRPDLDGIRPFFTGGAALIKAVSRGEAAVTGDVMERIQSWLPVPVTS